MVVIAVGWTAAEQVPPWGVGISGGGIAVKRRTYETNLPGVFAVGNALRGQGTTGIRSVADAKEAAVAIDQYLSGQAVTGTSPPFTTRIGKMAQDELVQLSDGYGEGSALRSGKRRRRLRRPPSRPRDACIATAAR